MESAPCGGKKVPDPGIPKVCVIQEPHTGSNVAQEAGCFQKMDSYTFRNASHPRLGGQLRIQEGTGLGPLASAQSRNRAAGTRVRVS
ncbi:MAG: hypothetical protein GY820_28610 [Gammaproteobacteria bacterium]|nr:hypothetical protein [Gammaproteobacteria bacterium]